MNEHVAVRQVPASAAQNLHETVACVGSADGGARLVRAASLVDFPCCDAGYPHLRSFGAPDRPIAVPNRRWCTMKRDARRNDVRGSKQKKQHANNPFPERAYGTRWQAKRKTVRLHVILLHVKCGGRAAPLRVAPGHHSRV
jgi:hypothetical protein